MNKRGMLTEEIKKCSNELLGYEIDTIELRLMPYLQYIVINDKLIDYRKINFNEKTILIKWEDLGFIKFNNDNEKVSITEEFWNIINKIIFIAYVNI